MVNKQTKKVCLQPNTCTYWTHGQEVGGGTAMTADPQASPYHVMSHVTSDSILPSSTTGVTLSIAAVAQILAGMLVGGDHCHMQQLL